MLEDPKALAALKAEIEDMIEKKKDPDTGVSTFTVSDLEGMKVLSE